MSSMTLFVVDVEADGPYVGDFSMVSFGIVKLQADLSIAPVLLEKVAPISENWKPEALHVCNVTREQHLSYDPPEVVMARLVAYLAEHSHGRAVFVSDNPAFDWQFINYYLHRYTGGNPFGWSARRIGDLYAGLRGKFHDSHSWKRYRQTQHTHNPLHDAMGNAEALLTISKTFDLKIV